MADVSKIKVPNGAIYNIKDETARTGLAGKAEAKHTHTEYALKSKYGDTTIDVGRKTGTDVGICSDAEGWHTTASGDYSHSEGLATTASNRCSHSEGVSTVASGESSHAEGTGAIALGDHSHARGWNTIANNSCETASGKYNVSNSDTLFSIGDGTADDARHNAFEITTTGGKLHDKNIATLNDIPTSLPANGGNANTIGGKSADDFVEALTLSQTVNSRIKIPDNVDVTNWLIENAKIGTMYYRDPNSQGQTNLPPVANISWAWTSFDGNNYFARVMIDNYSTRDFLLNLANFAGGWKEISTTPIKKMTFTGVAIYAGGGGILFSIDHGTPIAIACTSLRATQCTQFVADNTWYVLAKDAATLDPVPQGSYSFDVWYI